MSEHRDSGAAAPALQQSLEQQSLEQQPLPAARGLPGAQQHWGPWDGAPSCQVRAHTHTVTSNNLLVTGHQRTEQQVEKGWSSPGWEQRSQGWNGQDGECSNRERTKEGGREKEKEANPSSGCWKER